MVLKKKLLGGEEFRPYLLSHLLEEEREGAEEKEGRREVRKTKPCLPCVKCLSASESSTQDNET